MIYSDALKLANAVKEALAPHCIRIEIAGSIRRQKDECKDIEIVCIPKPYEIGLFQSGIATVINNWKKVKGELPCKYTQRLLPEGIKVDIFFCEPGNWGLMYAIRTGSADYSHNVLAKGWVRKGYHSVDGFLFKGINRILIHEEEDLFKLIGVTMMPPKLRNV